MTKLSSGPSHQALSHTDRLAANWGDFLLLVGRILLASLFLAAAWPNLMNMAGFVGYLTALKVPNPVFWAWIAVPLQFMFAIALLFGIATRYAVIIAFVFVIIATAIAHRYWEYPAAQQAAQYNNFLKNLAIMGGSLFLFVTGGGRYSVDARLAKRR